MRLSVFFSVVIQQGFSNLSPHYHIQSSHFIDIIRLGLAPCSLSDYSYKLSVVLILFTISKAVCLAADYSLVSTSDYVKYVCM